MNVVRECKDKWRDVVSKVNRAVVFMDDISAECLHWSGGAMTLLGAGAVDIKQFSSFESCLPEQRKAVFILSTPFLGTTEEIMRDIVTSSQLQYVIVFTTVNPSFQTSQMFSTVEAEDKSLHYIEDRLLEWMGNMNYTAEVEYHPLVAAPVSKNLFVLPSQTSFFPLLPSDLQVLNSDSDAHSSGDLDYNLFPDQLHKQIKRISSCLNSCLDELGLSDDVYAMGSTSRLIANDLAQSSEARSRRKSHQSRCSLVIMDRTLDLSEACSHQMDTLLDRVLTTLPRLPGHHNDVTVNMASVCSVSSNPDNSVIVPGCLAHPADKVSSALLNSMASLRHKEGLLELNRQLVDTVSKESLPLSGRPGRVTSEQLNNHIALFKGKLAKISKHAGLLQVSQAVADSLPHTSVLDALLGKEKAIVQSMGEQPSPLTIIMDMVDKGTNNDNSDNNLEALFSLLVYTYSLAESVSQVGTSQEERALKALLVKAIVKTAPENLPEFLQELIGENVDEGGVKLVVQDKFDTLRGLCNARNKMKQIRSVYTAGSMTSPSSRNPFIPQLVGQVFDPNKPPLDDLVCKSTGFTDKLKKGFGLFMSVSAPRPTDHPLVVIFIVGGTTTTEVKKITDAAGNAATNVLVGSTSLLRPSDVLHRVLVQDNLHPRQC